MVWTVRGVVVAKDDGWTLQAGAYVPKIKKWGNGTMNSGPSGYKNRPSRVLARAVAAMARSVRSRQVRKK